jgi:hypothetical protein
MAVFLSPVGGVAAQFFDNDGNVLSGGKINTYSAGTTTPQATYTAATGNIQHSNPIILDSAGRVPGGGEIWLTDGLQYKFVIKDANDVLIGTYDNIVGINSNFVNYTNQQEIQTATANQTIFTLTGMTYEPGTNSLSVFVDGVNQYGSGAQYAFVETDATTVTFVSGLHVGAEVKFTTSQINASSYGDAFQISYTPPFTGSVPTNVGDKLAQTVSVKDFGAVGDGVTDDTDAIQTALDECGTTLKSLFFPAGTYKVTAPLVWPGSASELAGFMLYGESANVRSGSVSNATIINFTATSGALFDLTNGNFNGTIKNIDCYGSGSSNTIYGIQTFNFKSAVLENVSFSNFKYGFYASSAGLFYSIIRNCHFVSCERGVYLLASLVNGTIFDQCRYNSCDYGFYTTYAGAPLTIMGSWFEGCTTNGFYGADATIVNFHNCYFEANGDRDISISSNPASYTTTINIIGCTFEQRTNGRSVVLSGVSYFNAFGSRFLANDATECIGIATTPPYGIISGCQFDPGIAEPVRTSNSQNLLIVGIQKNYGMSITPMTTTQKNAMTNPAAGQILFDTTLSKLCVYSGSAWQTVTSI